MHVTPSTNGSAHLPSNPYSTPQTQSTSYAEAAYQSRQSSITMKTEEGDIITISAAAAAGVAMNYGDWQSVNGSGTGFSASMMREESLNISVQGDLNEEELADMKKLLQDLHKVSTAFYAGNMEASLHHALSIGDMGSIKELEATFQHTSIAAASYASQNHPLPEQYSHDMRQLQQAAEEELGIQPGQDYNELLQAQWRQLQEYLTEDESDETAVAAESTAQYISITELLKNMQEIIGEAVSKHPRMSPFALPVAEKALQDAAAEQQVPEAVAARNTGSILQQLHGWLLTS